MVRSCSTALIVFLCLIVGSQALDAPQVDGPKPVTPPRPGPQITPDELPPGPSPLDEPTPDDLEGEFRITAIVAGEVIPDEENVALDPGELLTLRIAGQPTAEGEEPSAINWGLNRESKNLSIYPADGHHVTFTAPSSGAWLFFAAAQNPEPLGAPLLASRWVIVGTPTPEPGPKPDDPKPVPPTPPLDDRLEAGAVAKWVAGVEAYPQRAAHVAELAKNFRKAAAEPDVAAAKSLVADLNGKTLGDRWESWLPFFKALDADATRRKVTDADARAYFEAIAAQLEGNL